MTKHKNTQVETQNIRDIALAFDDSSVETMCEAIEASFDRRDAFEERNGLNLDSESSYSKAKAKMLKASVSVARFFLALDIAPSAVIERQVAENKMFNAKALDKVTELAQMVVGIGAKVQKVTVAFIACALAFDKGEAIDNKVNKLFLSNNDVSKLVADAEIADYIRDYQHKFMTGGKDTQSSQVRNVLDVLGLGAIVSTDRARGAVQINAKHLFFDHFRSIYLK
jgi:hypothetical protein